MASPLHAMRSPSPAPRPAPRTRPDLRVVPAPRHTGRCVALLLMIAALGVVGVVSLNALAAEASFESQALEVRIDELELRYDELTAEVAVLSSPERVRRVAIEELHMVPTDRPGFLVLTERLPGDAGGVAYGDGGANGAGPPALGDPH
ncbi:hypothetical protein BH23ACT7_BH23ACT7_05940 [soil metagenome]